MKFTFPLALVGFNTVSATKSSLDVGPLLLSRETLRSMIYDAPSFSFAKSTDANSGDGNVAVDIVSIGSQTRPTHLPSQMETWASHRSVRNFWGFTEDQDFPCSPSGVDDKFVNKCKAFHNSGGMNDFFEREYGKTEGGLDRSLEVGWVCAQRRLGRAFGWLFSRYGESGAEAVGGDDDGVVGGVSLPDYLVLVDDDSYLNMGEVLKSLDGMGGGDDDGEEEEAFAAAGCAFRAGELDVPFDIPYGGFGTILNKAAIQQLSTPIFCQDTEAHTKAEAEASAHNQAVCSQIESNSFGEASIFQDGMTLFELFYLYSSVENFCFHSDWLLGYVLDFYVHSSSDDAAAAQEIDTNLADLDSQSSTLQAINTYPHCGNMTITGKTHLCATHSPACHSITPQDMEYLSMTSYLSSPTEYNNIKPLLSSTDEAQAMTLMNNIQETYKPKKYAYITVFGKNPSPKQNKIYLDAIQIMARSLKSSKVADFVVLFTHDVDNADAEELLRGEGAIVKHVNAVEYNMDIPQFETWFVDIALAKLRAFELSEYERVQVLDADSVVTDIESMDAMFELYRDSKMVAEGLGMDSPLRAGWMMIHPSVEDFHGMNDILSRGKFDPQLGWDYLELEVSYPGWERFDVGGEWEFYGSTLEQGLMFHYFYALPKSKNPSTQDSKLLTLLDDNTLHSYGFVHFYGNRKPWVEGSNSKPVFITAQNRWLQAYYGILFGTPAATTQHNLRKSHQLPLTEAGVEQYRRIMLIDLNEDDDGYGYGHSDSPTTPSPITPSPSSNPSTSPTTNPSTSPSSTPSTSPSSSPSTSPSSSPSASPSMSPSSSPSTTPTTSPSISPSASPSMSPSSSPTTSPSLSPTSTPSVSPSVSPSNMPSTSPNIPTTTSPTETSTSLVARVIKLESTTDNALHMFEVQVMSGGSNVALNKIATQSSTHNNKTHLVAGSAVDGALDTFSSTAGGSGQWWEVDLNADIGIDSVNIYNRYCGEDSADPKNCLCRLGYADLKLYDEPGNVVATRNLGNMCGRLFISEQFTSGTTTRPSQSPVVVSQSPVGSSLCTAKKIKIQSAPFQPLHMFEVYVTPQAGQVASAGVASQSSTFKEDIVKFGPDNALDEDMGTFSHTNNETNPWWEIDYATPFGVKEVSIKNRWCRDSSDPNNCMCRLSNAQIQLYDAADNLISTETLGNTCGQQDIMYACVAASTSPSSPAALPTMSPVVPSPSCIANKVKLESTTDNALMMFEVEVLSAGTNVAFKKKATQSSTHNNKTHLVAGSAIDGDLSTFSSTAGGSGQWWEVDLQGAFDVTRINIANRYCANNCYCRLSYANVNLYDPSGNIISTVALGNTCDQSSVIVDTNSCSGGTTTSPMALPTMSPVVPSPSCIANKVKLESTTDNALHMFEVEVLSAGTNVALNKTASQSSTHNDKPHLAAGSAVDGVLGTFSSTAGGSGQWWEVDLQGAFDVTYSYINIYNRYCGEDAADPKGCLCRLSYADVNLYDGGGNILSTVAMGNTCGQLSVMVVIQSCIMPM